jgi:hypothetical protein
MKKRDYLNNKKLIFIYNNIKTILLYTILRLNNVC